MRWSSSVLTAALFAFLAVAFWGISFVNTKALLAELTPSTILVSRFAIGSLFLFLFLIVFRYPLKLSLHYLPHLFILGTLGVFIHQWLQSTSLLTIQASEAGWMISLVPIFTCVLACFFLHERFTLKKGIGMLLALVGVLLITNPTHLSAFQPGYILMFLSTINWAVYSLLLKGLRIPLPPVSITFYMCLIGTCLSLPIVHVTRSVEELTLLSITGWTHLLFLGVFVSAVAYFLWAKALTQLQASTVSSFLYIEPLVTFLAAIYFLNEKVLLLSIVGGVIIIGGVLLSNHGLTQAKNRE
ncbi:DMT family transporter [Shouchella lehensis]|uniref:Drug/metabolite transporter n=2 Tax=Shouchella lehensis TaxID=300825 RepID=A0A060LYW0_9BACI|nr:EamA family transporter [Shouchella lehensis]AIC96436.1 drug/metabolite transporter [Shouchella lehensis G1]MBG9785297.1 multidrug transporter [Shouchella lehensis]RQW19028.1 EamA family transporter [Bacillus sp. C1-1]TES46742.1 EamA family transporter [Shouchella lehensis]